MKRGQIRFAPRLMGAGDANPCFQSGFPSHKLMFKTFSLELLTPAGKTGLLPRELGGVR